MAWRCFRALCLKLVLRIALVFLLLSSRFMDDFSVSTNFQVFGRARWFLEELRIRFLRSWSLWSVILRFFPLEYLFRRRFMFSKSESEDDSLVGLSIYLLYNDSFRVSRTSVFWKVKQPSEDFEGFLSWMGKLRVSNGLELDTFELIYIFSSSPLILSCSCYSSFCI